MATSTTNYSFTLPEVGGDTDQWGSQLNANWTSLDSTLKTVADSVVDVTLTGNDYLTISGQAITVGNVDLTTDVTGTLPVGSGGTGLTSLGSANQVLGVNSGGTGLEYKTLSIGGTVTSVAVTGSDGIEIDSGSPITSSGTIALGINSTSLSTHLGLGSLATQSSVTESQISDLQSYLTAEVNDLSAAVTWVNVPDANITQSSVTQHQAALSITESQISDLQTYLTASSTATLTNKSGNISQWTNDSGYLTAETNDLGTAVTGTLGTANGGTGVTALSSLNAADLGSNNGVSDATDGYVLTADGTGGTAWEAATAGGGGLSDLEHANPVTTAETISVGNHRFYIGPVSFSNTVTIAGKMLVFDGLLNTTGTINTTGTLHVRG